MRRTKKAPISKTRLCNRLRVNKLADWAQRPLPTRLYPGPIRPAVKEIDPHFDPPFAADPMIRISK